MKYLFVLALLVGGCAIGRTALNEPLDPELIAQLEPGKMTAQDVVALMGAPLDDVSEAWGVTVGRWAWSSNFADVDNDGWQDIVVANGYITTEDTSDL